MTPVFASWLGPQEIVILLIIGVLLFGRKLPEVGRYLGKGIVEFKKGMKGLEDEIDTSATARHEPPAFEQPRPPQRITTAAPKFEDAPNNVTTAPHNVTPPPPQA
jgi:sec-independent protein translocase protein TatA